MHKIPVSWYIINYTNNIFTLQLGNNITKTYYISVGNYNANSLITCINTYYKFRRLCYCRNTG